MERQPKNSGSTGAGNGKGPNAGTKAGNVDFKDLQQDIKELSAHLKEIKNVIKQIIKDKNNKIPGIK
ncbi:MAG: hypothetical protein VXZ72_00105 [Chlamydiota bacterium]|nr:hypothetical protein [Chlamydiota bacterium]